MAPPGHPSGPPAAGRRARAPAHADVDVSLGGDRGIQVQLLRDRAVRPGCPGQLPDLLKCQRRAAGWALEHQPVLPLRVRLAGAGRLVAWAVPQAEQLPVELGQAPRIGGVQDRLPDHRGRLRIVHTATVGAGAANQAPPPPGHTSNNAEHGIRARQSPAAHVRQMPAHPSRRFRLRGRLNSYRR